MPSDGWEEVAADISAAQETAAEEFKAAGEAGNVEQSAPSTVDPVAEGSRSWADLSEVLDPTAASGDMATAELISVKEEEQELQEAVLSTIGLPEEVVDEHVATEELELEPEQPLDAPFLEEQTQPENPAEAAFTDLNRAKEEQEDPEQQPPVSPSEQADCEVDTTELAGEDTTLAQAEGLTADTSEAAVASEPAVADTSGVATEATTTDNSELVPPPTSPNLVDPGTEPIQVGHSPSAPSKAPRTSLRSSRGGATTRWQEARRGWWVDFEAYQSWLYHNSGGSISGGSWLRRIPYEQASEDQQWVIALHSRFVEEFTTSNCLAIAYNVFASYQDWAHQHGPIR